MPLLRSLCIRTLGVGPALGNFGLLVGDDSFVPARPCSPAPPEV